MEAASETKVVLKIIPDERNDHMVWDALYERISALVFNFDILSSKPKTDDR